MGATNKPLAVRAAVRAAHMRGDVVLAALDAAIVCAGMAAMLVLRFDGNVPPRHWGHFITFLPIAVGITVFVGARFGVYGQLWQHASVLEARRLVTAGTASLALLVLVALLDANRVPLSVVVMGSIVATGLQGLLRFQSRLFAYRRRCAEPTGVRVLVLGAGEAGAALVRDMLEYPAAGMLPVGFLDDDPHKHGRSVHGIKVLGSISELVSRVEQHDVQQAVLAISDAPQELVTLASGLAEDARISLRVIPRPSELIGGDVTLKDVRDLQIDDLLGRQQVVTDLDAVRDLLCGKRVLITGAGGSIGSEIARQVAQCSPATLLLLDHDETHLHDAAGSIPSPVTQLLVDIRQSGLVHRTFALHRPQIVFHAAAHKHVPLLESHPAEAIKTNVHGTQNLIDAAEMMGVERFVFISTDKAVRPSNVMGASKAVGEQIVLRAAAGGDRRYSAVRFGNVLGSRGSVIPTFMRQIQHGGPVTITDARMTRFFMSIPEAVQLVLQTAALSRGGEVFMLEMGEPVRIMDLAQRMIQLSGRRIGRDIEIRVTGMRAGEKLTEELSTPHEAKSPTAHPSIVRLIPHVLDPEVLTHEVNELVEAADNGLDSVVRSSVFAIATLEARRRKPAATAIESRRLVDLAQLERDEALWIRSTT